MSAILKFVKNILTGTFLTKLEKNTFLLLLSKFDSVTAVNVLRNRYFSLSGNSVDVYLTTN